MNENGILHIHLLELLYTIINKEGKTKLDKLTKSHRTWLIHKLSQTKAQRRT